jgi:hypothetical protein
MAAIEFVWDSRELEVWRGPKVEKALVRALSKAGADAIRAMKAESSRKIRERKRIKVARVNRSLPLYFPEAKELGRMAWAMKVSGKLVPLAEFPHRQTKRGVSVAVNVGQRKLIKGAFVATMKSGHLGIFMRRRVQGPQTKKQAKRGLFPRTPRLPIEEAFTTRIADVFADGGFIPTVQARGQSVFSAAFARLLPIELGKLQPKGKGERPLHF